MAIQGCEAEYERVRRTLDEYMRLETGYRAAGPPLATTPIPLDRDITPYILTNEMELRLRHLGDQRDAARDAWMKASTNYLDCAKRRG